MPNRVGHFEIHVDDMNRAVKFYTDVFAWEIQKWPMANGEVYYGIITGPREEAGGINGGFIKRPCAAPDMGKGLNGYCSTIIVDDYDSIAQKILAHGGKEAMAKVAIQDMAWQGYFIDTEGNTFGIHQSDQNAK